LHLRVTQASLYVSTEIDNDFDASVQTVSVTRGMIFWIQLEADTGGEDGSHGRI
jgi:hypothetical protein